MTVARKVEAKVKAASGTALVAAFVVGWLVKELPFLEGSAGYLQATVEAVVTSAGVFVAGWLARHTPRYERAADRTPRM